MDEGERITVRIRAIEIEMTIERIGPKRILPDRLIESAKVIEDRRETRPAKKAAA